MSEVLPRSLQVEVTGACNLRCQMCLVRYRPPKHRVRGSMTIEHFRALVDELPELEEITLQGLGEPLLAPDLMAMIEYAVGRGISVGFNTNATLLTRPWAEQLVDAGVDWIHVSIDGATAGTFEGIRDGARFDRVVGNLRTLVSVRRARGSSRPRLQVNFVAMRRNVGELPDIVRLAAELEVDRVWVQNLSHDFSDTDPAGSYVDIRRFAEQEALWSHGRGEHPAFAEARRLAADAGIDLRLPDAEAVDAEPTRPAGTRGCDWPWRSAYVTHDAKVQPCCMVMGSERAVLGDLTTESFGDIWNGEGYRAFRRQLLSDEPPDVCRGCSVYRGVF